MPPIFTARTSVIVLLLLLCGIGIQAIANALFDNSQLAVLSVSYNDVGVKGKWREDMYLVLWNVTTIQDVT